MVNTDNIGKRIKMLRKQKHVSQEQMAESLGMYQADISNLERGMGGSGISDIYKLDRIADYFDVPLVQLLAGVEEKTSVPTSEKEKSEEQEMRNYTITNVRYGYVEDYFVSELELMAPDKSNIFMSFSECEDEPRFYRTKGSIYDRLMKDRGNPEHEKELNKWCFLSGEDYIDIFQKVDQNLVSICRYLIFAATESENEVKELIKKTKGRMLEEIEVPIPSREPEELFYVDYSDLAVVYRFRLMVEESIKNPSIYDDIDDLKKKEKTILEKLKKACASEEVYKVWKKDLIDAKTKELMGKQKLVACTYLFAGMGQYKEIMPEEMVPSFKEWINCNGSAFFGGSRPATKSEIRSYASHHIADELLGIE